MFLVSSLLMISTITCTSHIQVVFNIIGLKLFHLFQSRLRPKLDSQKLTLCLLQVLDISTKSEMKLRISPKQEFKLTISLEKMVFHSPLPFKKLRFSTVLPKVLKTSPQLVNSKLSIREFLIWENNQIMIIEQSEINFWTW